MSSLDDKREARLAKLRAQRERLAARTAAREAKERVRLEAAAAREQARRMKRTPGDFLGSWQRPIVGEPPASALRCNVCLQVFQNISCWQAHRVHVGTPIERCAVGYELGAAQWERSAAGVWNLAATLRLSQGVDLEARARLTLERLATVRQERERFDFGLTPKLHFPARPAAALPTTDPIPESTEPEAAEPMFTEVSEEPQEASE